MAADNGNQFAMYKYVTLNKNIGKNESNLYLRMAASFGETKSQEDMNSYQLKIKAFPTEKYLLACGLDRAQREL